MIWGGSRRSLRRINLGRGSMGKIADTTRTWAIGQQQRQQMIAFDTEFEEVKAERDALKSENLQLRAQVKPLEEQVKGLKKRVEEESAKAARAEKLGAFKAEKKVQSHDEEELSENEVEALKLIGYVRLQYEESVPLPSIMKALKINEIRAQVLMRGLGEKRYVWHDQRIGEGWKLLEKGEEYLVKHNIA